MPWRSPSITSTILRKICAELLYDVEGRSALLSLARASTLFYEYAMEVLWNMLPHLGPLIYTMPSDLWKVDLKPRDVFSSSLTHVISFVRPLVASDFARFVTYAPRIRQLGGLFMISYGCLRKCGVSSDVLRVLNEFRPLSSLLPNLEHLEWTTVVFGGRDILPWVQMLYGPKLRYFLLTTYDQGSEEAWITTMKSLRKKCPGIQQLGIDMLPSPGIHTVLAETVCSFRHLISFDCSILYLHVDSLLHLASLPTLQVLSANFHMNSPRS
ncbi:hypothetical protein BKA93DRAFT_380914 [Sparassis latifolia]